MIEDKFYGPEILPKLVGGEYDITAIEGYVIESFEEIFDQALQHTDDFTKRRMEKGADFSFDCIIEHAAGEMHYTAQKIVKPNFTQYSVSPKADGPHVINYDNDLFEGLDSSGEGFLRIVVGVNHDDFAMVVQIIGDDGIENVEITNPEEMVVVGNIVNLLKPILVRR